jgi:hypothetical protein
VRSQITLRLSGDEIATLDAAAARLRVDRASLIRAAALGLAEVALAATPPLLLMADPAAVLARAAARLGAGGGAGGTGGGEVGAVAGATSPPARARARRSAR